MTDPSDIACILLAAGEGRRFGCGKLLAPLDGKPLGLHSAATLKEIPFAAHIAVSGANAPDFAGLGFEIVAPDADEPALSASIAAGVAAVADRDIAGVLIALADMPCVPAAHIHALIAAFEGEPVATIVEGRPQPPALFGMRQYSDLRALSGDRGAQSLLRHARALELSAAEAFDVDTLADLETLRTTSLKAKPSLGDD